MIGAGDDSAIGQPVPIVSGIDYEGNATVINPSADGPAMIVLLAHWCLHCNADVPRLNERRDSGEVPDGLNIVGVSTGVRPDVPTFPPDQWLVDKDWQWPVLADESGTAMAARPTRRWSSSTATATSSGGSRGRCRSTRWIDSSGLRRQSRPGDTALTPLA